MPIVLKPGTFGHQSYVVTANIYNQMSMSELQIHKMNDEFERLDLLRGYL